MAANEDGTVKSDDELHAVYTGARLDQGESTVAYCRIGCPASKTTTFQNRVRFIGRRTD